MGYDKIDCPHCDTEFDTYFAESCKQCDDGIICDKCGTCVECNRHKHKIEIYNLIECLHCNKEFDKDFAESCKTCDNGKKCDYCGKCIVCNKHKHDDNKDEKTDDIDILEPVKILLKYQLEKQIDKNTELELKILTLEHHLKDVLKLIGSILFKGVEETKRCLNEAERKHQDESIVPDEK